MRWVHKLLSEKLAHFPHLLIDADDLQRKLKSFQLPVSCRCVKLDVKDFHLTGKHTHLVERSASILEPSAREDYSTLTKAILSNQYVRSDVFPSATYKVVSGTGMGMIPSGSISDACLYANLERDYVLKPCVRRKYLIYL